MSESSIVLICAVLVISVFWFGLFLGGWAVSENCKKKEQPQEEGDENKTKR